MEAVSAGVLFTEVSAKSGGNSEKDLAPRRETNTVSPPFDSIPRAKRGRCERRNRENSVPSQNFFRKNSGKVLTEQNANVLLEIFPLTRGGSLKFTLYD